MPLNAEQKSAVQSEASSVAVIAGAGSGKTSVICHRVAWLMDRGVPASQILVVTFSRVATKMLHTRIQAVSRYQPEIRTLHSWCAELLRGHASMVKRTAQFSVYDDIDSADLLRMAARDAGIKTWNTSKPETLRKKKDVLTRYLEFLRMSDAVDMNLIETLALQVLQRGIHWIEDRYRWIIVDEAQDLNRNQWDIISMVSKHVFAVADPRQCIYTWRGSAPEMFVEWMDRDDVEVHGLKNNYRSGAKIIEVGNQIAPERWSPMTAATDVHASVEYISAEEDSDAVLEALCHFKGRGVPMGDVAILGRTWRQLRAVYKEVQQAGYPVEYHGPDWNPWDRTEEGRALARYLQLWCNPLDDNLMLMLTNWGVERFKSLGRVQAAAMRNRRSLLDEVASHECTDRGWDFVRSVMLDMSGNGGGPESILDSKAHEVAQTILELQDFEVTRTQQRLFRFLSATNWTLRRWRDWWAFGRKEDVDRAKKMTGDNIDFMSVHAAKGLEFPVVIVIGCADHMWPGQKGNEQEERRLMYVAATRAERVLVFTRCSEMIRKGGPQPARWSRFMQNLPWETR